ncbi:MAG TPA: hypothetical protein EYP79_02465, partial [Campylobacterales bacterium]|nr:hypothetical protein [Campylobacterales bacterium]
MKKLFLISIFFILLNADIKFVTVESIGFAASKQDAIENALINAVAKVNGLSISSAKIVVKESVKSKIYVGNSSRTIKVLSKAQAQAIASKASGAVYSYRIIYLNRSDYGYEAKVAAVIAKYKSPGLNPRNRRSLAILPFEYKPTYFIFGITINGKELSDRLTQSIVNKITQTRKFTVLDRENSKYYQIEKSFLTSGNSDPIELVRLGKRLGADYFVIGKILDLDVYKNTTTNYYTGERTSKNKAFATISYRILNIPTQQIKWSDTIDIEFTIPNKKRLESLVVKIGDKIAQELVDQIIYNIYPPK